MRATLNVDKKYSNRRIDLYPNQSHESQFFFHKPQVEEEVPLYPNLPHVTRNVPLASAVNEAEPLTQAVELNNLQIYILTFGLNLSHTSTVKTVALLLNADERDDIKAAIITAIIKPTKPVGRTFRTSLPHAKDGKSQWDAELHVGEKSKNFIPVFPLFFTVLYILEQIIC